MIEVNVVTEKRKRGGFKFWQTFRFTCVLICLPLWIAMLFAFPEWADTLIVIWFSVSLVFFLVYVVRDWFGDLIREAIKSLWDACNPNKNEHYFD